MTAAAASGVAIALCVLTLTDGAAANKAGDGINAWGGHARSGPSLPPPPGLNPRGTAAVPECVRKLGGVGGVSVGVYARTHRQIPRGLRRIGRCLNRVTRGILALSGRFLTALIEGREASSCRLLTQNERARLGGSQCSAAFEAIEGRVRPERRPIVDQTSFSLGRNPRGEFTLTLERPFEMVGLKFEAERVFWRIKNTRDLFRQEDPVAPPPPA